MQTYSGDDTHNVALEKKIFETRMIFFSFFLIVINSVTRMIFFLLLRNSVLLNLS